MPLKKSRIRHPGRDPRGNVRDVNRGVGHVDVLAACTACPVGIDLQVLGTDVYVDVRRLRQHRDGRGGCVDPASRLRDRNALYAVNAALELELAVCAACLDTEYDLLVAADPRFVRVEKLHRPALPFREASIHAKEVCREKRGFFASRTAANLYHDVFVVVLVLGEQQNVNLVFEVRDTLLQRCEFLAGQRAHLLVLLLVGDLLRLGDFLHDSSVFIKGRDDRFQFDVFFPQHLHLGGV